MNSSPATANIKRVRCPSCGANAVYAPSNPFRPFCNQRCKEQDLGAWASERFRLPDNNSAAPANDSAPD